MANDFDNVKTRALILGNREVAHIVSDKSDPVDIPTKTLATVSYLRHYLDQFILDLKSNLDSLILERFNNLDLNNLFSALRDKNTQQDNRLDAIEASILQEVATLKAQIEDLKTNAAPTGLIVFWPSETIPSGFLIADGSLHDKDDYPALFNRIAYTYSLSGDTDLTKFRLPDLRGAFPRGWDNGRGLDPGRNFGTYQDDAFSSHAHSGLSGGVAQNPNGRVAAFSTSHGSGASYPLYEPVSSSGSTNSAGSNETRPKNLAGHWLIKT